ncbi:histidine kinase [Chryseomicrobium excrementi]|uniref:Histidine kinase n=1 Tax=Chryseomicrobium excrementi TaxID=2041346 RepID=A0A2M9EZL1_9BACL|nr:universal stress protein [Chryseomicrobium excrementi]PJK16639.1 histidine kinase [Chryseomicrobium excrementi]
MGAIRGKMDERILVCVFYGPNGERLIRRGHQLSSMLGCPFYVLTVDPLPVDEFDAEKTAYIERWKDLTKELGATEFVIRDNEKRPTAKVIAEVANQQDVTQIIIGQTAKSRWEEITKGSFINSLLRELPFVDLHVVSVARTIRASEDEMFERGIRCYLIQEGDSYVLSFAQRKECQLEGIFFKEVGTDFNNGIFKFMDGNQLHQVSVHDGKIDHPEKIKSCIEA